MLSYEIDGSILTLKATGGSTETDRQQVFDAIASDARVPALALLLVDASRADAADSIAEIHARAPRLVHLLGPKLGPRCAVLCPPRLRPEVEDFRAASKELGLRVEIFEDEASARAWLIAFARDRA